MEKIVTPNLNSGQKNNGIFSSWNAVNIVYCAIIILVFILLFSSILANNIILLLKI
jgi:hypothetical protein